MLRADRRSGNHSGGYASRGGDKPEPSGPCREERIPKRSFLYAFPFSYFNPAASLADFRCAVARTFLRRQVFEGSSPPGFAAQSRRCSSAGGIFLARKRSRASKHDRTRRYSFRRDNDPPGRLELRVRAAKEE